MSVEDIDQEVVMTIFRKATGTLAKLNALSHGLEADCMEHIRTVWSQSHLSSTLQFQKNIFLNYAHNVETSMITLIRMYLRVCREHYT